MGISLFILLFFTKLGWTTTFVQVPLESQIKESQAVIMGHFLSKNSVRLDNGKIATQMHFELKKEVGLNAEFFGLNEVIVHYPGGELDNSITRIEGIPDFIVGEKVVILLTKQNNRFWGLNLAYGSFKVVNFGRSTMVMNNIFPEQPHAGQMRIEQFESLIKEVKGVSLKVVQNVNHLEMKNKQESRQNRSIASVDEESENMESKPERPVFWLMAFLALMGGIYRWSQRRAN